MEQKKRRERWELTYTPGDRAVDERIRALAAETGLTSVAATLLYTRGYRDKASVERFLHLDELCFHDPFLMQDMDRAVARIEEGVARGERIAIYGDYDVDGVTSVSLLYLYLRARGADVGYYIPSRIREGYGLSKGAIDILRKEKEVDLMITVDTGITAIEEIDYASELGLDVVVTDHHECRSELPRAVAVVNPHRPDDAYPFKELAGVGVVFKLLCAMELSECRRRGEPDIEGIRRICRDYTDLVAIGTVADVMSVVGENRLIISMGLSRIEKTRRPGLMALIEAAGGTKRAINSTFIGFVIAPRMNAAGRVSSASIAVELLLAEDKATATRLSEQLCELNTTRQVEENRIAEQAYKKIEDTLSGENNRVIVIDDDTWQQGIIGIVSSRITERYGLPSILISFDGATRGFPSGDDMGKGSGRSIKGLNLVEALTACEELLVRFGGHELAAGLTVQRSNIDAFREKINRYANRVLTEEMLCVSHEADCVVEMSDLTMRLYEEISMLEPFGTSNPSPEFVLRNAIVRRVQPIGGGKHTKLILEKDGRQMTAVWFGNSMARCPFEGGEPIDVLFQLNVNEFQGVVSLQMIVRDLRPAIDYEELMQGVEERYEEIRSGAVFTEEEHILPDRDDMAEVYTFLRREYRMGHTAFSLRRLTALLSQREGRQIGYIKLKFIIRIMQELQICGVTEADHDRYVFEFNFHAAKTNIEKSSILRKLRSQMRRA